MIKIENNWETKNGKYECPYCKKEYSKKGIATHIWRNHGDGINHNPSSDYTNGKRQIWNKGLTKDTDNRVKKYALKNSLLLKQRIQNGTFNLGKNRNTPEALKKRSIKQSKNNSGGKCKWYVIDGKKVQGTWELNIAKRLNEFKIQWQRGTPFVYIKEGKEKRYTPDFYLPEYDLFLEIKGYWWGTDKEKMKLVFEQIIFLKDKILIIEKDLYKEMIVCNKKEFIRNLSR